MKIEAETHPKGWGEELWIINLESYCGKVLRVNKGKRCSLHYHIRKTETMHVLRGRIVMKHGPSEDELTETILVEGESFHVRPLLLHQFLALEDTEILEVSTQHFEDDSIRVIRGD